jgi:hypothetical protein
MIFVLEATRAASLHASLAVVGLLKLFTLALLQRHLSVEQCSIAFECVL